MDSASLPRPPPTLAAGEQHRAVVRVEELLGELDRLLEGMAEQQRGKVLEAARKKIPHLTADDVQNPEAWPELYADGPFNYEDGILNGLLTAQMAVRARLRQKVP